MSAIFGGLGHYDKSLGQDMAVRLAHRGMESNIEAVSRDVFFGSIASDANTTLARIDGFTCSGDIEIYNAVELVGLLTLDKSEFTNPAELLLTIYLKHGMDGLNKINGQFSFSIWNESKRQLVLGRDYTGTYPLYYVTPPDGSLLFASEYKALLCHPGLKRTPDLDMIQRLQHYKHLPSTRTLLKEVTAVPPGTLLVFDDKAGLLNKYQFPPLSLNVRYSSVDDASQAIERAFLEATKLRTRGKENIGIALSGGIDSIGVSCASQQSNPDATIYTYTAGSDRDDPEIKTAEYVAEKIGSIHKNVIVTPDDLLESVPGLVWHLENPIARTEALQFYKIGQAAGGEVDTLVTGAAADGLFAGMPKHKLLLLMHYLPFLKRPLAEFYTLTQSGLKPETLLGQLLDRLYFKNKLPDVPIVKGSEYRPEVQTFPRNSKEFVNEVLCRGFQEGVAQWLPKIERTLQSKAVNYASPFLDRDFIELAFATPSKYKIMKGKEKFVLRHALRRMVPAELLQIPKFPMRMKYDNAFSDTIDALAGKALSKERVEQRGFFAYEELKKLQNRPSNQPYTSEAAMRIWTAALTEIWATTFIDNSGEAPVL